MEFTNRQILDAAVALLNPYAWEVERIRAADALLRALPDAGEAVTNHVNCQSAMINGMSRQSALERIKDIYAYYGEKHGIEAGT